MSVGEALAQARVRAGLTVEEVSARSLIRATVISSIEDNDYEACGGPIYVNGYIRAIAAAVGIDPAPLIRSYAEETRPQTGAGAGESPTGPGQATEPDAPADVAPFAPWPAAEGNQAPDPEPPDPGSGDAEEPADRHVPADEFRSADERPPAGQGPLADQRPPAGEPVPADEGPPADRHVPADQRAAVDDQGAVDQRAAADELRAADEQEEPAATGLPVSPVPEPAVLAEAKQPIAVKADPADTIVDLVLPWASGQPAAQAEPKANEDPRVPARDEAPTQDEVPARDAAPVQDEARTKRLERVPPAGPRPAVTGAARSATRQQAPPGRPTEPPRPSRTRERRRVRWAAGLAVLLLVLLGFAGREIFAGVHRGQPQGAAAANPVSTHRSAAPSPAPSSSASRVPSHAVTPSAAQPAVQSLTPANAAAFGPAGTSDGDNPTIASRAITGPENGWETNWYATPAFGALKQGTGLMVDMGAEVSITSVSIQLGKLPGANLELFVGDEPVMAAMRLVKQVTGAGGQVVVPVPAVQARYFLIWFTKLPPDGAGTFQANIDGIAVQGYRQQALVSHSGVCEHWRDVSRGAASGPGALSWLADRTRRDSP